MDLQTVAEAYAREMPVRFGAYTLDIGGWSTDEEGCLVARIILVAWDENGMPTSIVEERRVMISNQGGVGSARLTAFVGGWVDGLESLSKLRGFDGGPLRAGCVSELVPPEFVILDPRLTSRDDFKRTVESGEWLQR